MGRLNGRQMGHPTGTTLVAQSSTGGTHHRTGMMMAQQQQQQQHVPHYQLPPTPPQHHPVHHLGYVHPHLHHVANNSTKDVCDEMDSDPTTLLKHTPSSSQKFIPQGNQYFFLSAIVELFVECRVVSFSSLSDGLSASARSFSAAGAESSGRGGGGWM